MKTKVKKLKLGDVILTPINFECLNCFAPAGQPCTKTTSNERVQVSWFHLTREASLEEVSYAAGIEVYEE